MLLQRWAAIPVSGSSMEKFNLPFFYQLGAQLNSLAKMNAADQKTRVGILVSAMIVKVSINDLFLSFSALTVCRSDGNELISAIQDIEDLYHSGINKGGAILARVNINVDPETATDLMYHRVIDIAKKFEIALNAELQTLPIYHVTQKGIYSPADLISRAENAIAPSFLIKFDDKIKKEIRESGRCLAFDTPTASGFHIIRAMELVIHQYYLTICKPEESKNLDSWAAYIGSLQKTAEANPKDRDLKRSIALIQQIKDNDRNLIMHPELVLSFDEAFSLFEIAKSAIIAMAARLPEIHE